MIAYQPAYDPYHAAFRLFRLKEIVSVCQPIEIDRLKILDFFIAFPFFLSDVSFKSSDRSFKKVGTAYNNLRPFADLPERRVIFRQMKSSQDCALATLTKIGAISTTQNFGRVEYVVSFGIAESLIDRVDQINRAQDDLLRVLSKLCCDYEFLGDGGLKHRTGLMEYRYDTV